MRSEFDEAVRLFNSKLYFQAHEAWEELWHQEIEEPNRLALQGFIQIAAGLHKLCTLKQQTGADYLLRQGLKKLHDNEYAGHNVKLLRQQIRTLLEKIQAGDELDPEKLLVSLELLK